MFTVINKSAKDRESDVFSRDQVLRIQNIFEIIGRIDPSASVIVNEEPVPGFLRMAPSSTLRSFANKVRTSGHYAQDRSGNFKTLKREVFID
jgi:hypothetical protein